RSVAVLGYVTKVGGGGATHVPGGLCLLWRTRVGRTVATGSLQASRRIRAILPRRLFSIVRALRRRTGTVLRDVARACRSATRFAVGIVRIRRAGSMHAVALLGRHVARSGQRAAGRSRARDRAVGRTAGSRST